MIPPVLLAIHFGTPFFDILVAAGVIVMAREWATLTSAGGLPATMPTVVLAAGGMTGLVVMAAGGKALYGLACPLVAALVIGVIRRSGWLALGALYVGLPALLLLWLREADAGRNWIYWIFFVVWVADTGAFACGRAIGGRKLAPAISPGKTWAGLAGAILFAGLAGAAVVAAFGGAAGAGAWTGAVIGLVSQLGDLFESGVKRRFGVKDTGTLIPGHGGLLDRVDGLLAAALAAAFIQIAWQSLDRLGI